MTEVDTTTDRIPRRCIRSATHGYTPSGYAIMKIILVMHTKILLAV